MPYSISFPKNYSYGFFYFETNNIKSRLEWNETRVVHSTS